MKKKTLLVALLVLLSGLTFASDEVSIVVSSDGATKDEAIKMALRSAIEQTFGAFVSSNSTVLNDQLVNDEIVSLSNGNVKSYEILTESALPNNRYFITLRATICMNKLVNYINSNSKSSMVEVNMDAFDKNIRLAEMNRIAERKVFENVISQIKSIENMFDFDLQLGEPKVKDGSYVISGKVLVRYNQNTDVAIQLLREALEQLKMSESEVAQYESMGLRYYVLTDLWKYNYRNGFGLFDNIPADVKEEIISANQRGDGARVKELVMKYDGRNELLRCTSIDRSKQYSYLDMSDRLFTIRFNDYQIGDNVSMPSQLTIVRGQRYGGDCFNKTYYNSEGELKGQSIASELTDGSYSDNDDIFFDNPCQYAKLLKTWLWGGYKPGAVVAYCEITISIPPAQASKYSSFVIQPKTKR